MAWFLTATKTVTISAMRKAVQSDEQWRFEFLNDVISLDANCKRDQMMMGMSGRFKCVEFAFNGEISVGLIISL